MSWQIDKLDEEACVIAFEQTGRPEAYNAKSILDGTTTFRIVERLGHFGILRSWMKASWWPWAKRKRTEDWVRHGFVPSRWDSFAEAEAWLGELRQRAEDAMVPWTTSPNLAG